MPRPRTERIVRNFPENGMKLLLEAPKNVRDLLRTTGLDLVRSVDFDTLAPVKATFIQRDYRHVEADVVMAASLRGLPSKRGGRRKLWIYILIEHQSEPDRLILLRVLDYVVQIFKFQERQWRKTDRSLD